MIHNLYYSSGDIVSFDDTVKGVINESFKTDYVELPGGKREVVGYLNGITFFEGDEDFAMNEVNWYQVSKEDKLALNFASHVY